MNFRQGDRFALANHIEEQKLSKTILDTRHFE
jgi:hypothetical protein